MIQQRSLVIVLAVSFLIHGGLLVSSARHELDRARQPMGELLAAQLAGNAAPLIMNRDTVGVGLLAERFGNTPGVLSLKVMATDPALGATGGTAQTLQGVAYRAPIVLENKPLGEAEVVLASPANGEILRNNGLHLLISLLLHAGLACWLIWPQRFRNLRVPILQPLPRRKPAAVLTPPEPAPVEVPPAATFFLQVALEDPKGLMQRVNASTADQMLVILEKLLLRSAKLYQGKVLHSFGPEGATVRFAGDDESACLQQALACGRLFLALADAAYQQRRNAKLFALSVKAAVCSLDGREEGMALDEALQLARRGTAQDLLLSVDNALAAPLLELDRLESLDSPPKADENETPAATEDDPADASTPEPASPEPDAETVVNDTATDAESTETSPEADSTVPAPEEKDAPANPPANPAPWRVRSLAEADEARILEQKQQILERRKPAATDAAPA